MCKSIRTNLQSTSDSTSSEDVYAKKKKTLKELRAEGGITTFNTSIGALNLFAIYYFFVSVALGIPWVIFCKCWQIVHWLSRGRFDPRVRFAKVIVAQEDRTCLESQGFCVSLCPFRIPHSLLKWKSHDSPFFTYLTSKMCRSLCNSTFWIPIMHSVESLYLLAMSGVWLLKLQQQMV